jgi:hypothetical protein
MRWSQLRKQIEERFAPSIASRVALHTAHYRHAHDGDGRAWIEVDRQEVATMCYFQAGHARLDLSEQLRVANNPTNRGPAGTPLWLHEEAIAITRRAGVLSQEDFYALLHDYLRTSVTESLRSDNPITRALAVIDARVGKRRLRQLAAHLDEHPLVRMFLALRCKAEGIDIAIHAA